MLSCELLKKGGKMGINIVATGHAVPDRIVDNEYFTKIVDTSDEWIQSRTGIETRHFCNEDEYNWEIAAKAAENAINNSQIDISKIRACIVATFTPDNPAPSVACMVQKKLGLSENIMAFDINAACSGFLYGVKIASSLLDSMNEGYILLIGSEKISSRIDMTDRSTCVLFGDGAGAVLLSGNSNKRLYCTLGASGNESPLGCRSIPDGKQYVYMEGSTVFKFAVNRFIKIIEEILDNNEITIDDVDYVVCHQANERIIKYVIRQMKAPEDKFYINVQKYGNTSAASIPIALDEMNNEKMLTPGKKVICVGFGAGYTWGGAYIEL